MSNKIKKNSFIFVAGHNGLVGSSVIRRLKFHGYKNILTISRNKLDLRNQSKVNTFFRRNKIEAVINAAAIVGGIYANNKYKANFIYDNILIQSNIINSCFKYNIKQMIFLGSSCVYPRNCKQPIKEEYLLKGELEKTNEPYAVAKISGIKMCESFNYQYKTNYKCLMPCNTYGPNDNYDTLTSHFFPALIKKIHDAKIKKKKSIVLWGKGKTKREIMYVDDLADACIHFMNVNTKESLINVGSNYEKTILEYANFIIKKLGLKIKIRFDKSKPNGTPRKILNSKLAKNYGWEAKISLNNGFEKVYSSFLKK